MTCCLYRNKYLTSSDSFDDRYRGKDDVWKELRERHECRAQRRLCTRPLGATGPKNVYLVKKTIQKIYSVAQRVCRVLSFSPLVQIGTPPPPHPQASVPPPWFRGREILACGRGVEESHPTPARDIHCGTLHM